MERIDDVEGVFASGPVTVAELKAARQDLFDSGELEIAALGSPRVVQRALEIRVEAAMADLAKFNAGGVSWT